MKRRTFLKVIGATMVAAVAGIAPAEAAKATDRYDHYDPLGDIRRVRAESMSQTGAMHLYDNGEGELVAANSMEEAAHHLDVEMGGCDAREAARRLKDYFEIEDGAIVPIIDSENGREIATKMTAKDWAAQYAEPCQVASTYW